MKKILSVMLLVLSVFMIFTSCGKKELKSPKTIDVVNAVKSSTEFTELVALNNDNISRRYFGIELEKIEEYTAFVCSNGAEADEIAVFKMKSNEDVESMKEIVNNRKQELYDSFVDYVPEEIPNIENALIGSNGKYVYLVICGDKNKAESAIKGCF